jgi:hypothetical protein
MTTDPNEITQATGLHLDWLSRELDIAAERLQTLASVKKQNQITKDAFDVATGYRMLRAQIIAEHPADSDLPVTEEWLRSVGFETAVNPLWIWARSAEICLARDNTGSWVVTRADDDDAFFVSEVEIPAFKTRGDVRRLCVALGIPLPDQPKGGA